MAVKKSDVNKRDMNFFTDFASASGQMGSMMTIVLVVFLALLFIEGAVFVVLILQNTFTGVQIAQLNDKMNSEEYTKKLNDYVSTNSDISTLNQEFYDISALFSQVKEQSTAKTSYLDAINAALPSDCSISNIDYADDTIKIEGGCSSYFSPLDLVAAFTKQDLFHNTQITSIEQVDLGALPPEEQALAKKYKFVLECNIASDYTVNVSRLVDDTTAAPIADLASTTYTIGQQYSVADVATYTAADGTIYTLNRIQIDGVTLTDDAFKKIQAANTISGIISSNKEIKLYYLKGGAAS